MFDRPRRTSRQLLSPKLLSPNSARIPGGACRASRFAGGARALAVAAVVAVLAGLPFVTPASAQTASAPTAPAAEAPTPSSLWPDRAAWDAPEPWLTDRWYLQTSLLTIHFHPDDDHKQAAMLDTSYYFKERWLDGQWFAGLSLFTNSFGQFSQYAYGGLKWRPWAERPPFYLKVSAGIVHGYSGEYQDKIPFNSTGFAPAIIPAAGYCWDRYCSEVVLLGANALLWTLGVTLP